MLHVRLLGELQADVDGRPVVPPASRRAWSLLAWLALHPGEHPRGTVAARFWPDVLDSSARASLRSAAWALRRALGDGDALVAGRDRIGLRCQTDIAAFDAHCAAGELEAGGRAAPRSAARRPRRGLGARSARRARRAPRVRRSPGSRRPPPPAEAVAYARRRLALDPLDEEAARDLMRRLARSRRPRRRARDLRPSRRPPAHEPRPGHVAPRRARWRRACASGERATTRAAGRRPRDGAGPATVAASGRRGTAARARGSHAAIRRWSAGRPSRRRSTRSGSGPASGAGAIALISGEGGIGKTRLATELLADAPSRRAPRAPRRSTSAAARRRSDSGPSCSPVSRASSTRRPPTPSGRRSSEGSRPRCRDGSDERPRHRRTFRPTSHEHGCSRPRSSSRSTPRQTARSSCCSTTSTSRTRRRSSSPPTSRAASLTSRSCSSSRAARSRAGTRSTRSSTPPRRRTSRSRSSSSARSNPTTSSVSSARAPT